MANGAISEDFLSEIPHLNQVKILGSGTFGIVLLAQDLRSQPPTNVAVKLMPRGSMVRSYKTYLKREIVHTSSLRHPLIVSLKEAFLTSKYLGISMEFCSGGDLYAFLASKPQCRLSENEARWIFQQLIVGLSYCHTRGVANRDLKLENILLDTTDPQRPLVKICDFGYSKHEMNSSAKSGVGTTPYMAPEVLLGSISYNAKGADIWSAGVLLFALLEGRLPFDSTQSSFARNVVSGTFQFSPDTNVSDSYKDLLSKILQPDPNKRVTVEQIIQHEWFLQDLPVGCLEMNASLLDQNAVQDPEVAQSLARSIDALVESATVGMEGEDEDGSYDEYYRKDGSPMGGSPNGGNGVSMLMDGVQQEQVIIVPLHGEP